MLVNAHACKEQTAKFKRFFGESVEVTVELCKNYATEFSFMWAADNLLPVLEWKQFIRFCDEQLTLVNDFKITSFKWKENIAMKFAELFLSIE